MLLIAEASNGKDALIKFQEHLPDITLMDLRLSDINGIDAMLSVLEKLSEGVCNNSERKPSPLPSGAELFSGKILFIKENCRKTNSRTIKFK